MALTNHPCAHYSSMQDHPNYNAEFALISSGHSLNSTKKEIYSVIKDNLYSACKPGPSLIVKYTGLALPASKVTVEKISGHSSIISWKIGIKPITLR